MRRPTKSCPFCEGRVHYIDYKDDRTLGRFITDHGKILPSRLSGVCARHVSGTLASSINRRSNLWCPFMPSGANWSPGSRLSWY